MSGFAMCPCGEPLIPSMHVPKAEFYCLCCGRSHGMFGPGVTSQPVTAELAARFDELKAEWDEYVEGELLVPRSWLRGCRKCDPRTDEYHELHASDEERDADRAAREWLRQRIDQVSA